jgi:hypothetical protein
VINNSNEFNTLKSYNNENYSLVLKENLDPLKSCTNSLASTKQFNNFDNEISNDDIFNKDQLINKTSFQNIIDKKTEIKLTNLNISNISCFEKINKSIDNVIDEKINPLPKIKLRVKTQKNKIYDSLFDISVTNDGQSQLNLNNISIVNLSEFMNNVNNKSDLQNINNKLNNDDQFVLLSVNEAKKLMESTDYSINSYKNDLSLRNTFDSTRISNLNEIPSPTNVNNNEIKNNNIIIKSPNFAGSVCSNKKLLKINNIFSNKLIKNNIQKETNYNNVLSIEKKSENHKIN